MSTFLIYSVNVNFSTPVGILLGNAFHNESMGAINPLSNVILLRYLRQDDCNHPHLLELKNRKCHFTLKVFGKFDLGSIMGFSGMHCFHFTKKSTILLYLSPKLIAGGHEKCPDKDSYNFTVYGDVRLVANQHVCNIYLIRGFIYESGMFLAINKDITLVFILYAIAVFLTDYYIIQ